MNTDKKTDDNYRDIPDNVEVRFDTSVFELNRVLKGKH